MRTRLFQALLLWLLIASLGVLACDLGTLVTTSPGKPQVVIQSPSSGRQFREGDEIAVQSTATDPAGITRVELVIDGVTTRTDTPPTGKPQASFTVVQRWKATAGTHTLSVRAYNASGTVSDPAIVSITVGQAAALVQPTAQATVQATAPLPPTQIPTAIATPTQTPTPTQTLSPTPNPKDLLLAALSSAIAKTKTYRVKVPEEERLMEVILPDRVHQLEQINVIKIGSTIYTDFGGGDWRKQSVGPVPYMDKVNLAWYKDQVAQSTQNSVLGPSTIDGIPCVGYLTTITHYSPAPPKYTPPPNAPTPTNLIHTPQTAKIWFATTDGLPRRIELGAPSPVTIIFYDFNAEIQIDPPM